LKILLVSPRYIPYIGGVEYVVKSIAERLAKIGHEVTVLTGEPNTKQVREEFINNVKVIRWPTWTIREAYHIPKMRTKLIFTLKKLIREIDVIHVHSAHAVLPVYIGIKVKELNPDVKLIFSPHYHAHGHTLIRELMWQILWRKFIKKLVKYSNKIHAVSIIEAERIVRHYPEVKDKLVVIPNGIEEDVLRYKWKGQNSDYILYAGRIEKYKRLEVAIDLVSELNGLDYNLKLIIVGKGTYVPKLRRYAMRKIPYRVEFKAPLPRAKYLKLLANAYSVINPSLHEAFSILVAESLAIGVPAIVSETIFKIYMMYDQRFHESSIRQNTVFPNKLDELQSKLTKFKLFIIANINRETIETWNSITNKIVNLLYRVTTGKES